MADDLSELYGKIDAAVGLDEDQVSVAVSNKPVGEEKPPGEDKPAGDSPAVGEKPDDAAAKEAPEPEKPLDDKAIAAKYPSLARTVKILTEREEAVRRGEQALKNPAPQSNQALMLQFKRDPAEALAKIGFDPAMAQQILRIGIAKGLGDKAPDQYKKLLETTTQDVRFDETSQEIENLKNEIKRRDMEAANNAYVTQYKDEVSTFLAGAEKDAPLIHRMFGTNKDKAMTRVMAKVMEDAKRKIDAGDRNAQPMSAAEAALMVEADLEDLRDVFGASNAKQVSTAAKKDAGVNLSNKDSRPSGQSKDAEVPVHFSQRVDAYMKSMGL